MPDTNTIKTVRGAAYMDMDDDIRYKNHTGISYNMGMELGVIGNSFTKIKGNTKVSYPLPDGENQCIGFGEDVERQRGVYMIYNSNKDHLILCYTLATDTIELVAKDPILNFQLTNIIRKVEVINGVAYWTDGYDGTSENNWLDTDFNSGRQIDIDKGIAGFYSPFTLQSIQRIKYPPAKEPLAEYNTDSTIGKNLFQNEQKLCQFAYCYKYYDASLSVYSPLSALAVSYGDETVNNSSDISLALLNNVIKVTINTGSYLVTDITIGLRFGNIGEFGTFITLNKADLGLADDIDYVYNFYNDRRIEILDQTDWVRLYDNSPQVENTLELVKTDNGSNLVSGQCTEGFDNVKVNITLQNTFFDPISFLDTLVQPLIIDVSSISNNTLFNAYNIHLPPTLTLGSIFVYKDIPDFVIVNSVLTQQFHDEYTFSHVITTDDVTNPQLLSDALYQWLNINHHPPNSPYQVYTFTQNGLVITEAVNGVSLSTPENNNPRTITGTFYQNIPKHTTFKSGARHLLGIEYGRDEGWEGTVQTSNISTVDQYGTVTGTEIYIPFITEVPNNSVFANPVINSITTTIYHKPPIWATKYRWVYAGNNSIASFIQFTATDLDVSNSSKAIVYLKPLYDYWQVNQQSNPDAFPKSPINYSYTPGDRCRLISQNSTTSATALFNTLYDVEVIAYDAATNKLTLQGLTGVSFGNQAASDSQIIIEIYTPFKQNNNPIYYELSETFDIGFPHTVNRYHKGTDQDQYHIDDGQGGVIFNPNDPTIGAITTLLNGDCWIKVREMSNKAGTNKNYIIEDYNFSDFYISNSYDKGRPNIIDPYAKRESLTICRHSQIFQQDSQINGLSSFWGGAGFSTTLGKQNGIITGLEHRGYELMVYQWQKDTSILIQRTIINNTNGTSNIAASNNFFGTHQPREGSYGTTYPESICGKHNRYFFDVINGSIVRDSTNGNWDISSMYKITNFINELSLQIKTAGKENFNIYGYYDQWFDKVYFTVVYNIPKLIGGGLAAGGGSLGDVGASTASNNPDYKPPIFTINGNQYTTPLTIVFVENGQKDDKGFQGFAPFKPEFYGSIGNQMLSFRNGSLYKHTDTAPYNYFYDGAPDDNEDAQVELIDNTNANVIKTAKDIQVYSDKLMYCGDKDIKTYPQGQESRLLMKQWNKKESVWGARFLRNTLGIEKNPVLNSSELKYQAMKVRLRNTTTEYLLLNSVIITSLPSPPLP